MRFRTVEVFGLAALGFVVGVTWGFVARVAAEFIYAVQEAEDSW